MKKYYKPKTINITKLKSYLDKSLNIITMTNLRDTIQVGVANGSAIGFSITDCNEILTFVSLILAIIFTIYKFSKYEKEKA